MKKLKVYLDTSSIGGCFDVEFSEGSNKLFEYFRVDKYIPVISEIVIRELEEAPENVQSLVSNLINVQVLEINNEITELADLYLQENIVTEKYKDDALHIAIATHYNIDVLVSWNFKHIVNLNKIHMFNSINIRENYQPLEIRTPKEIIDDE